MNRKPQYEASICKVRANPVPPEIGRKPNTSRDMMIPLTISPVMAKEIIYQAVDYLGIGRVLPFLKASNEIFTQRGITLPLEEPAISTAGWRPTVSETTIPAPALPSPSGK